MLQLLSVPGDSEKQQIPTRGDNRFWAKPLNFPSVWLCIPPRQVSRYSIPFFFLLRKSYFLPLSKIVCPALCFVFSSKLIMMRGLPSLLCTWLVGEPNLQRWWYKNLVWFASWTQGMVRCCWAVCVCIILFVFLSQHSAAILERTGRCDAKWIEPKLQKDQLVMAWLNSFLLDTGTKHLKCCFCWDGGSCRNNAC